MLSVNKFIFIHIAILTIINLEYVKISEDETGGFSSVWWNFRMKFSYEN